jgi:hypothetical protein
MFDTGEVVEEKELSVGAIEAVSWRRAVAAGFQLHVAVKLG